MKTEWNERVEVSKREFLSAGEAWVAMFRLKLGLKETTFNSSWLAAGGTLLSASAVVSQLKDTRKKASVQTRRLSTSELPRLESTVAMSWKQTSKQAHTQKNVSADKWLITIRIIIFRHNNGYLQKINKHKNFL